jgi:hypothetical protein
LLWFSWLVRVVGCTLFVAALLAGMITLFIYLKHNVTFVDAEVLEAVKDIWTFWFALALNISLLFALFRSVKYLFNKCYGGYMLKLKLCQGEQSQERFKESIGYGDLIKVWRKWFMLLIWLVGAELVFTFGMNTLVSSASMFDWFNIYTLYFFIAVAAYFSFVFLAARCQCIKVVRC